ncbi:MAG: archaetidylserine decarboxylase [Myxococcota bacterium]
MNTDRWLMAAVRAVPRRSVSRLSGRLASMRARMAVRQFAARFDIDLDEAEKPIEAYDSVLDLFTRRLRAGARPVDARDDVVVSPTDGALAEHGRIDGDTLVQAKGRTYSLTALLAEQTDAFKGGSYATLYLSPRDYHRVHSPVDGEITGFTHVPGDLFPVNQASVSTIDGLYARNERVITHIASSHFGRVAVVKVGATNVGRITLTHCPALVTNTLPARSPPRRQTPD